MSAGQDQGAGDEPRIDASEADPDAASTADLPGYSAADRTAPGEQDGAGGLGPGDPHQEPGVGRPAQDTAS